MIRAVPIYPGMPRLSNSPGMGFAWAPIIAASIATSGSFALSFTSWNKVNANQKRQTSNVADSVEQRMQELKAAYLAFENRGSEDRRYALSQWDMLWQELSTECSRIGGGAGQRCIEERKRGGKWDWFKAYRDPIEEAPIKEANARSLESTLLQGSNVGAGIGGNILLLGAGLGLLVWGLSRK